MIDDRPTPRLRFDAFGKRFGLRQVLKSASLWVWPGRVTLLMGRNGSGKTTLLRCGLGLMPSEYGSVQLDGRPIRGGLPRLSRAGVSYLPDRRLLSPRLTLRQHHTAFARARGRVVNQTPASDLDIGLLLDKKPAEMSGGERRRAEIWLSVATASACLLADEPLLGVSPADRSKVAEAIRSLAASGVGVLVTGHEVEDLFELADEVIWMVAGTTHGLGTPAEAARHAQFRAEYLGAREVGTRRKAE